MNAIRELEPKLDGVRLRVGIVISLCNGDICEKQIETDSPKNQTRR